MLLFRDGLEYYFTSGIECENFGDILIDDFHGEAAPSSESVPAIVLRQGKGAIIRNCRSRSDELVKDLNVQDLRLIN